MKRKSMKLLKVLLCLLALAFVFPVIGCVSPGNESEETKNQEGTEMNSIEEIPMIANADLSGYRVVYGKDADARIKQVAALVAEAIGVKEATDETAASEREILIGVTNRAESREVAAVANLHSEKLAYAIEVRNLKIVIAGKSDDSVIYGAKFFKGTFLDVPADIPQNYARAYATDNEVTIFENLTVMEVGTPSTVIKPTLTENVNFNGRYPRLIRLEHQSDESQNGALLMVFESADQGAWLRVMRSDDDGETWKEVSRVKDEVHENRQVLWQPCLYELPVQVGDMPKGTILCCANACKYRLTSDLLTILSLWSSDDAGLTWKHVSDVDQSFESKNQVGVWEPVLDVSDDGKLMCFYSDENDKINYNQRLVYRVSEDGINWGEVQNAVAVTDMNLRPGMLSYVKLNNGKYMGVYEIVGLSGGPVHYRYFDSLTEWGDVTARGTQVFNLKKRLGLGTSPAIGYTDGGGDCGVVFVAAEHMMTPSDPKGDGVTVDLFLSLDYGENWIIFPNPMPYKNVGTQTANAGYSSCFFTSEDKHTVYFAQGTDWDYPTYGRKAAIKMTKFLVW